MPLPSPLLILMMLLLLISTDREEIVNSAVAAAAATGGATVTQTTDDLQSNSSREVPLGEASLFGVSHILISVSTMELFFRRFDMLQEQLDELKSLMIKGSDSRSVHSIVSSGGRCSRCG